MQLPGTLKQVKAVATRQMKKASFVIFALCLCASGVQTVWGAERASLVAVYIFRLAGDIKWPASHSHDAYEILVIDDDRKVSSALEEIAERKTLHGKPFNVRLSSNYPLQSQAHIVYIARDKLRQYSEVFTKTTGTPTLIITDQLGDERAIMVDLKEEQDESISFSINRANIVIRDLTVSADITLLGGTEVDVALLYREGQRTLQKQNAQLAQLSREIQSSEKHALELADNLDEAKNKIRQQESMIVRYSEDIRQQQVLMQQLSSETDAQKRELETLRKDTEAKRLLIEQTGADLKSSKLKLWSLQQQIAGSTEVLQRYAAQAEQQLQVIKHREEEILQLGDTVSVQKHYLTLLTFTGLLLALLALTSYKAYRNRQKLNAELTRYTEELESAKQQAEESAQAKTTFLSNMSHELRSPLTSIIGFSNTLMLNPSASGEVHESMQIINRSGEHLLSLINDILDLSKVELSKLELDEHDFDLYQLLQDVTKMMAVNAHKKGLSLDYHFDPQCPRNVHADGTKLRRVLINLISNAIKFTRNGGVTIRMNALDSPQSHSFTLQCQVEDTGIGIRKEDIDKLFQPFEQMHAEHEVPDTAKGTGLGLSLCKELLGCMGGTIQVSSTPGSGSIFEFQLTVAIGSTRSVRTDTPKPRRVVGLKNHTRTLSALVVEDIADSSTYLRRVLERVGCQVSEARNGSDAVQMVAQEMPDIIWMDNYMHCMDGLEATRIIRSLPGGAKAIIVLVTASSSRGNNAHFLNLGFDDVIYKPYLAQDIYQCMNHLMGIELIYEDAPAHVAETDNIRDRALKQLHLLPVTTLQALHDAAVTLDVESTNNVIAMISEKQRDLALLLGEHANDLNFERLQALAFEALACHSPMGRSPLTDNAQRCD